MGLFSRWFRSDLAESLNRQLQEERDAVQYWQKEYGNKCAELVAAKELDAQHLQTAKCFIKDQEGKLIRAEAKAKEMEARANIAELALAQLRERWACTSVRINDNIEQIATTVDSFLV